MASQYFISRHNSAQVIKKHPNAMHNSLTTAINYFIVYEVA